MINCVQCYMKNIRFYGRDRLQLKELKDDVFYLPRERQRKLRSVFIRVVRKQDFEPKNSFLNFPQANTIMSFCK